MAKITKNQAKRKYEKGESFIIVACNLRPEFGIPVTGATLARREGVSFSDFVNSYEYYNCNGGAPALVRLFTWTHNASFLFLFRRITSKFFRKKYCILVNM